MLSVFGPCQAIVIAFEPFVSSFIVFITKHGAILNGTSCMHVSVRLCVSLMCAGITGVCCV